MPFGAHETMEVHEILSEKLNMMNHFSLYAQFAQAAELREMIERQMQSVTGSYDQLVAYTHDYSAANQPMPAYPDIRAGVQPQQIQYGLRNPAPVSPELQGRMNDSQILCAMLSFHKSSAKLHMQGALECADPNVRHMLIQGAITCADQSYEVFLLMNRLGQYQVPTMNDHTAKTYLHTYQPMQSMQPMQHMQQSGQPSGMAFNGGPQGRMNPFDGPRPFGGMMQQ